MGEYVVKVYPVTHNSFPNLLLYHAITTFLITCENAMLRARTEVSGVRVISKASLR